MSTDIQDYVYMIDDDLGQTSARRSTLNGQSKLLDLNHPCLTRLNCGSMRGIGVQFYNESGEIESGVQVKDYHYFIDENNKVRPIPPGSVLQGMFSVETPLNPQPTISASGSQKLAEQVEKNVVTSEPSEANLMFESSAEAETKIDETQASGSGFDENMVMSQGMDIELEEEIISCDIFLQEKVAPKAVKGKSKKKKKSQVISPKNTATYENQIYSQETNTVLLDQFNKGFDANQLSNTLNQLGTGQVAYLNSNFNAPNS